MILAIWNLLQYMVLPILKFVPCDFIYFTLSIAMLGSNNSSTNLPVETD